MSVVLKEKPDTALKPSVDKNAFKYRFFRDLRLNKYVYLMLLPVVAYYIVFYYVPMYGLQIAFKDFSPGLGMWESPWVGFSTSKAFLTATTFGGSCATRCCSASTSCYLASRLRLFWRCC